jgi:hypothetical protein
MATLLELQFPIACRAEEGPENDAELNANSIRSRHLELRSFEMEWPQGPLAAGGAPLQDMFMPHFELVPVELQGKVDRQQKARVHYTYNKGLEYFSTVTVTPRCINSSEPLARDERARPRQATPQDYLQRCAMTGMNVPRQLLVRSDLSGRFALPEHTFVCNCSRKKILSDEAGLSDVTGQVVARLFLKRSAVSGKLAEPEHFGQCDFTQTIALHSELGLSEISGRRYRLDEEMRSAVSGKVGHCYEFIRCHEGQLLAVIEAERCEMTGYMVRPGVLERCSMTGAAPVPSELERCGVAVKRFLKKFW